MWSVVSSQNFKTRQEKKLQFVSQRQVIKETYVNSHAVLGDFKRETRLSILIPLPEKKRHPLYLFKEKSSPFDVSEVCEIAKEKMWNVVYKSL